MALPRLLSFYDYYTGKRVAHPDPDRGASHRMSASPKSHEGDRAGQTLGEVPPLAARGVPQSADFSLGRGTQERPTTPQESASLPTKTEQAPGQAQQVLRSPNHSSANAILTSKELNVLELVSYGYDNRAIAEHFQITRQAVKNMMRIINLKLGADNRAHAFAVCFRNGWLSGGGN
jgi:DNA-binding CsgD family transcriptional regulator